MRAAASIAIALTTVACAAVAATASVPPPEIVFASDRAIGLGAHALLDVDIAAGGAVHAAPLPISSEWARAPDGRIAVIYYSAAGIARLELRDQADVPGTVLLELPGTVEAPAFSPDGAAIAFDVLSSGYHLWVVRTDGSGAREVIAHAHAPVWSPDGNRLLYRTGDGLGVVGVDGSAPTRIVQTGVRGVWSPDGTRIAYEHDGRVAVIRADGTGVRVVGLGYAPSFSPDGRQVAFVQLARQQLTTVIARLDGTIVQQFPGGGEEPPAWSPDGRLLAYVGLANGVPQLFVADLRTKALRQLTHEPPWAQFRELSWSGDGRSVWAELWVPQNDLELYTMASDGSGLRALTHDSVDERDPSWSPDGRRVAYTRNRTRTGSRADLWVMNADGGDARRLTRSPYIDTGAAWSPDGRRIVFARWFRDNSSALWVVRADGSGLRRLTSLGGRSADPAFSPDGRLIAFSSTWRSLDGKLTVVSSDGASPRRIPVGLSSAGAPAWSPDGSRLAFIGSADEEHGPQLYVVPAGGGLPTPIAEEVGDSVPAWSPDGTQLLYAGTSRGLWLADVGGGGTVALLDDYSRDVDPDWRR